MYILDQKIEIFGIFSNYFDKCLPKTSCNAVRTEYQKKTPKKDFSHYVGLSFHEWGCNQADMTCKYRRLK